MNSQPLEPPSTEELIDALAEIVNEAMAYKRRKEQAFTASGAEPRIRAISAAQLFDTDDEVLRARDWVADPVYRSLKKGATEIGKILHRRIGDEGMTSMAEEVCSRDEKNWSRRMSFVDSAFNGIGTWYS